MTDLEVRMTIKTLARKGVTNRAIARQLGLSEGTVRYQLKRQAAGAEDGRAPSAYSLRESEGAVAT